MGWLKRVFGATGYSESARALVNEAVANDRYISVEEVAAVLDELADLCLKVVFDYRWRPQAHDPNDDLVLETAINGGADVVSSFNVADMKTGAQRFGIPVERPGAVMRRMER